MSTTSSQGMTARVASLLRGVVADGFASAAVGGLKVTLAEGAPAGRVSVAPTEGAAVVLASVAVGRAATSKGRALPQARAR